MGDRLVKSYDSTLLPIVDGLRRFEGARAAFEGFSAYRAGAGTYTVLIGT